jgi:hypothetical protein
MFAFAPALYRTTQSFRDSGTVPNSVPTTESYEVLPVVNRAVSALFGGEAP